MATAKDQERRQLAWIDFCNLEHEGVKPNPNALYEYYIKLNREHPEQRSRIPTTNRTTVYLWAREDKWVERYQEMKKEEALQKSEQYANIKKRSYGVLVGLQGLAIETLTELAAGASDPKVRLQAAESILDRTGLGKQPAKAIREEPVEQAEVQAATPISPDASEEETLLWIMQNKEGGTLNA